MSSTLCKLKITFFLHYGYFSKLVFRSLLKINLTTAKYICTYTFSICINSVPQINVANYVEE